MSSTVVVSRSGEAWMSGDDLVGVWYRVARPNGVWTAFRNEASAEELKTKLNPLYDGRLKVERVRRL